MAIITKIEIANFFGKGNFVWDLDPQVNILGGKNGSGKTSILRICYSLLSNTIINNKQDDFFSKLFDKVCLTFDNGWSLVWNKKNSEDTVRDDAFSFFDEKKEKITAEDWKNEIQVFYLNTFEQRLYQVHQYEKLFSVNKIDDSVLLDLMIKDQINIRNGFISKIAEKIVSQREKGVGNPIETLVYYTKLYSKIFKSLEKFFVDYDKPFESDFSFKKNGEIIGVEGLSMGEKQILLILLMVSNTENSPCIFFMDEPDLSMHIDWKEILVTELHKLNPNMQIILSTHAPSVITGWHDRVKEVEQLIRM